MATIIYFLIVLLILLGVFIVIGVGLFIGVLYLIMYFLPDVELVNVLIPAAILTTAPILMFINSFKQLINETYMNSDEYLDDEE